MANHKHWVFSNKAGGHYGNLWDMDAILKANQYSIFQTECNRKNISAGDVVFFRTYGDSYLGHCIIAGPWTPFTEGALRADNDPNSLSNIGKVGYFPIKGVDVWAHPLPQSLIMSQLSNGDFRSRIISITADDAVRIEAVRRANERIGYGGHDGTMFVLEKGLEEAIKPNLAGLGLRLANDKISQQFSMGPDVGRSDLICLDKKNNLCVVELKRGFSSDQVVGQTLAYMGYVRENIAGDGQGVKGLIIVGRYDERLRLAAKEAGIEVRIAQLGV